MATSQTILPQHVRRRRASFVLTSLIDVIFLLVIFFMVSSQIVPFSVIGLGPIASETAQNAGPPVATPAETTPVAVRVMAGSVRMAGETVTLGQIAPALERLKASGAKSLLLIPTSAATVQDIVSVLEAVKAAAFGSVTVLNGKSAQP